jgi:hypothetical protein
MEPARRYRCGRGRRKNCQKTSREVGIRFFYSLAVLAASFGGGQLGFVWYPPKESKPGRRYGVGDGFAEGG